jgi:membrane protein YdbS with pleckstrin-like domain
MAAMTAAPVREPAWPVARSAIGLWITHAVIGTLFWGALVVAAVMLVPADLGGPVPVLRWLVPVLVGIWRLVAMGVQPFVRYRVHRWEVTADTVHSLTGWLTRTWTLVPVARIQTVDVTQGALQRMFGLSSVAVLTASSQGTVTVPQLETDVAHRVADDLARRADAVRDEAT